jgi:hypothetical protein
MQQSFKLDRLPAGPWRRRGGDNPAGSLLSAGGRLSVGRLAGRGTLALCACRLSAGLLPGGTARLTDGPGLRRDAALGGTLCRSRRAVVAGADPRLDRQ